MNLSRRIIQGGILVDDTYVYDGWIPDNVADQVAILGQMLYAIDKEPDQKARIRDIGCLFRFLNEIYDKHAFTCRSLLHCGEIHKSLKSNAKELMDQAQALPECIYTSFMSEAQSEIEKFIRRR